MRGALAWWPWLLCAGVLLALGLQRTHVTHAWLAIGAFAGCALLLVVGVCWGAQAETAADDEASRDSIGRH
jgi:hypothetical protein